MAADSPYGKNDRGVLQAIGLAVVNFSQVEEALTFATTILVTGVLADDGADLVLRKLQFRVLQETFSGLYRHRFPNDDVEPLKELCANLTKLNDDRNRMIHSFWTPGNTADKLGRYRRAMRSAGPKTWDENVSEADVLEFATRADRTYGQLLELVVERIIQRIDDVIPKRK